MNVVLWICQAVLALLFLSGGYYKTFQFADDLVKQFAAVPRGAWKALGVLEMVGGILLIVPAATKWMPGLTPLAAAVLAVEATALSFFFARYSLKVTAENPLVFNVVMAVLAVFVAWGRYALRPVV